MSVIGNATVIFYPFSPYIILMNILLTYDIKVIYDRLENMILFQQNMMLKNIEIFLVAVSNGTIIISSRILKLPL